MNNIRKIMVVLCCLGLICALSACSTKKNNLEDTNVDSATASVTTEKTKETTDFESATEASESFAKVTKYPITITDSQGSEVTFDSEPMKVVSMAPNITEMMYQLGLESKLVGRTDYCDYPKQVSSIESVGTLREPDIEKIISLEPDVVIASTHFSEEANKKLVDLGVKVVVLYDEFEIEGVYSIIASMGTILNANETAAAVVHDMNKTITEVKSRIEGLHKPSVYYVVGYGEYGDYTAGGDTFIGQMLSLAGGNNIAQDISGWSYTLEALVEADPDIIIIPIDLKADFEAAENYKDLSAVKNDHVYGINKDLVERQGYRNAEGLRALAEIIHPEAFQ